jgi:hypothetical protein
MVRTIVPILIALLAAAPLAAQNNKPQDVPPGHLPPAGMCRIWIDGVPAGQQAAPTDCPTAVRNRPANGRVIFGDDNPKPGKNGGFTPSKLRDDGEAKPADVIGTTPKLSLPRKSKDKKKDEPSKPKPTEKQPGEI